MPKSSETASEEDAVPSSFEHTTTLLVYSYPFFFILSYLCLRGEEKLKEEEDGEDHTA